MIVNQEILKTLISLIISVMSFFGWNIDEYKNIIPDSLLTFIPSYKIEKGLKKNIVEELIKEKIEKVKEVKIFDSKKTTQKPVVTEKPKNPTKIEIKKTEEIKYIAPIKKEESSLTKSTTTSEIKVEEKKPEQKIIPTDAISLVRSSTVNIYCSMRQGNAIKKTTGSGVVISESGAILTNAHVAEYVMISNTHPDLVSCFIRSNSPAKKIFKANIVYLPPIWIEKNKNNLSLSTLTGTGEYDYAIVVPGERISNESFSISFIDVSLEKITEGENLLMSGYPAGFGSVELLDTALYSLVEKGTMKQVMSFDGSSSDVFQTSPTPLAEHGSSGGPITDESGNLLGIIVATTVDNYSGKKNIQAISISYINRNIKSLLGSDLETIMSSPKTFREVFLRDTAPNLSKTLLGETY